MSVSGLENFQATATELAEISHNFYARGWVLGTSGNFSAAANPRIRSTVTPLTSPPPSLMAKKADAAGAVTTPPRNLPVGASCLRSSELVMAMRLPWLSPYRHAEAPTDAVHRRLS